MNNSASLIYLAPSQTYISNDIKYYNIKYYKNIKYIYIHKHPGSSTSFDTLQ